MKTKFILTMILFLGGSVVSGFGLWQGNNGFYGLGIGFTSGAFLTYIIWNKIILEKRK